MDGMDNYQLEAMMICGLLADYCPEWGEWEGLREFVQNWMDERDAHPDRDHEWFVDAFGNLVLFNPGGKITRNDLMMGGGRKGTGSRGRHREGLKVASLALIRSGLKVDIDSCGQWFRPVISSPTDGADEPAMLFFENRQTDTGDDVLVRIHGGAALMDRYGDRLILDDSGNNPGIIDGDGGAVYVAGIWVSDSTKLELRYNLPVSVGINRDRDLVHSFDLLWETTGLCLQGYRDCRLEKDRLFDMIHRGAEDVRYIASRAVQEDRDMIASMFTERFGASALPCRDQSSAAEMEHHGFEGVISSEEMCDLLKDWVKERLNENRVVRIFEREDLDFEEALYLDEWLSMLGRAGVDVPEFQVAEYRSQDTMAMRDDEHGCTIARWALGDSMWTLKAVVEETAHHLTLDGDAGHRHKHGIHDIYNKLVHYMSETC